ncbi:hypothetical protein JXL21_00850 [Candidatus Bathyarchaeota archaeon]|nr:hypothetical protein [Candidatus Bathyarchaeota archaeon]
MKSKYILAVLVMLGLGIMTTMAFQLNETTAEAPEAYTISTEGTDATITNVKIRPSKGGDRLILKYTLSGTSGNSYDIGLEFEDSDNDDGDGDGLKDLSGASIDPTPDDATQASSGYIEYSETLSGASASFTVTIDLVDVYSEVDGLMILVSDA